MPNDAVIEQKAGPRLKMLIINNADIQFIDGDDVGYDVCTGTDNDVGHWWCYNDLDDVEYDVVDDDLKIKLLLILMMMKTMKIMVVVFNVLVVIV